MSTTTPTIDALRGSLDGRVIQPGDGDYDEARAVFYGGGGKRPAAVARGGEDGGIPRGGGGAPGAGGGAPGRGGGGSPPGSGLFRRGGGPGFRGKPDRGHPWGA